MNAVGLIWFFILLGVVLLVVGKIVGTVSETKVMNTGTEAERAVLVEKRAKRDAIMAKMQHGDVRPQIVCPQCQQQGNVRCKSISSKKGISGGKAVGALLTGGVSVLATGLSRKEASTEAYCSNCQSTWHF